MWKVILILPCVLLVVMDSEAAEKHKQKRSVGSYGGGYYDDYDGDDNYGYNNNYGGYGGFGAAAGAGFGAGFGTGFGGGFAGGYAPGFGGFGFVNPYAFHNQLTSQILAQNAAQQSAIASIYASGDSTVSADASNLPNHLEDFNYHDAIHQQAAAASLNNVRRQNNGNFKGQKGNRYAPNYAAAAASVGPDGNYQTIYLDPENPDEPNISNRFSTSSGPGGFKGVSVSSFSTSSNINGKKSSHRSAHTTINDNGRITTYKSSS